MFLAAFIVLLGTLAFAQDTEIRLNRIVTGITQPTDIQADGSGRLFFVQQNGLVRVFKDGALLQAPFLDIRSRTRASGECGLLGLAFPPDFAAKGYFYVNYTTPTCNLSVVARYRLGDNPDLADSENEQRILTQTQPFANHNGGQLVFGPDGYLYIGFGDGGSANDPQNHGQNRRSWLGKMLRIDTESGAATYRVPESNPFAGDPAYLPEIWALGLRNPWRYSFDRDTGDLWIADVGQNRAEEVHFTPASSRGGENYGWRIMEGLRCFPPAVSNCDQTGLTAPVIEYTRERGDVSVTGGFVYRGSGMPAFRGTYFYADFATGRVWGLRREGGAVNNRLLLESRLAISTFGQDEHGEIYLGDHRGAGIYRIEAVAAPRLSISSAVNAATFEGGLVAGSLATLFVTGAKDTPGVVQAPRLPLPTTLDGIRVQINGRDAPLLAIANSNGIEQINFQAPFDLAGPAAAITVHRGSSASPEFGVALLPVQPGIFQAGGNAILVRASDNSLVTAQRPLRRDDFAYFYAAGLGPVDNAPATGAGAPSNPLARIRGVAAVTIDGVPCEVGYAGLAPGLAGVYQINIRAAAGISAGTKDLVLTVNNVSSRPARVVVE